MSKPNDPWPKYWTNDSALKISERAARSLNLSDRPVSEWALRDILRAALLTLLMDAGGADGS